MAEYDPLSSISWQLKRIADELAVMNQRHQNQRNSKIVQKKSTNTVESPKLRQLLDQLDHS